jgi:hypothetical protein
MQSRFACRNTLLIPIFTILVQNVLEIVKGVQQVDRLKQVRFMKQVELFKG